jgi:lysophospholipase L1-like esterase
MVKFKRVKDEATGQYVNLTYPAYTGKAFDPVEDEYPYPLEAVNMTYDGLHPSDKGYEIIAGMLVQVFKKMKFN